MGQSSKSVSEGYLKAFAEKDFELAGSFLSRENFHFVGPLETLDNADALVRSLTKLGPVMDKVNIRKVFVDGDDVCTVYDFITNNKSMGSTRIVEWHHIEMGKIDKVEIFFDPRPYVAVM